MKAPRHNILLVEDDERARVNTATLLEISGFRVWTLATGEGALEAARNAMGSETRLGVAVIDMNLGAGPNGLEVCRALREGWPELPVVISTGDSDLDTTGLEPIETLFKPYLSSDLIALLESLVA